MGFTNLPKIRMHQYEKGWLVEIQKRTWYGKKYWTHLVSYAGLPHEPFYYSSYDLALSDAVLNFKHDLMHGAQYYN